MRDPDLTVEADIIEDDTSLPDADGGTTWEDDYPIADRADESSDGDDAANSADSNDSAEVLAGDAVDSVTSDLVAAPRWVPLGSLRVEYRYWVNPRRFTGLDAASIKDLAADVAAKTRQVMSDNDEESVTYAGIDDPMLVVRIQENGEVIDLVIDGQRRERAARTAYKNDLDVLVPVRDLEPDPVIWTQTLSNKYLADSLRKVGLRAGLSAFELARNAEFLRGQRDETTGKDYTLEKIAGVIGRSESWVSKILTALNRASPKLIHRWETGQVTEEQFRDLSATKDPEQQTAAADAVVLARAAGDSAAGRTLAKEQLEIARASRVKPAKEGKPVTKEDKPPGKASKGKAAVVRGPQGEFPAVPPRKPPPFAVVEDMLDTATKKPPTSDYVKGMLDGVRWATGLLDAASLGKPWQSYLRHVTGGKDDEPSPPAKAIPLRSQSAAERVGKKSKSKSKSKPAKKRAK
jgi:ParB-like chromosome segregation protein Spo0J